VTNRAYVTVLLAALLPGATLFAAATEVFHVDKGSQVVIHVGKAGAFGFAGHAHEVAAPATAGTVTVDRGDLSRSQVEVEFDAASLKVTGKDEPAGDVPEVQRVMLSDRVLDVKRYPKIVFRSLRVAKGASAGDLVTIVIDGELTLHGVTRPCRVPVSVRLAADSLMAHGSLTIKQSDYGIQPVTAGGGSIRVKDELEIVIDVRARH
jgi:polyisoprenoid-binding protein YceI